METSNAVVCSFYTADAYYRGHAAALRQNLETLGLDHELLEIEKQPGEQWPDICRKKIPFLAGVCERYPTRKVYWIDVDCQLLAFPDFVADFSGDLIGFQRGFSSPSTIGYSRRTRFWEPCFFGINATVNGRKFIEDARDLEAISTVRATDDYFFEESWRANAPGMSFQIIPSISVSSQNRAPIEGVPVFFSFGASGNVAEFKDKVEQHAPIAGSQPDRRSITTAARAQALRGAKAIERRLPENASRRLRKAADSAGVTQVITGGGADAFRTSAGMAGGMSSPNRGKLVQRMIMSAQRGEALTSLTAFAELSSFGPPTAAEMLAKQAADSFLHYDGGKENALPVSWWPRPLPGNFGDWLSPLLIASASGRPVRYISPTARSSDPHIVAVGSIGRFVKPKSVVVGTGISSTDIALEKSAEYVSVRGPITAQLLVRSGGPNVESFGDPGALMSRVLPMERGDTNGRLALIRHHTHLPVPLVLPEDTDELSVLVSHPNSIAAFIEELHRYDGVITSAMHVMIVCHSYGIPCALVAFDGFESSVHGTGIKYEDYSRGAGLDDVHTPDIVAVDLRDASLRDRLSEVRISEQKLDEIEAALRAGVDTYLEKYSTHHASR